MYPVDYGPYIVNLDTQEPCSDGLCRPVRRVDYFPSATGDTSVPADGVSTFTFDSTTVANLVDKTLIGFLVEGFFISQVVRTGGVGYILFDQHTGNITGYNGFTWAAESLYTLIFQ